MRSEEEIKPVMEGQESENRRAISKPFHRQKQSVDLGDGCDLENTKLINNDIRDDKDENKLQHHTDDKLTDNAHWTDMTDQIDINNHSPEKYAESCQGNVPISVISDACSSSHNSKKRRIAFSARNGRSTDSREDTEVESPSHHEQSQETECCTPPRCHGEQCKDMSLRERCSRHVL